MSQEAYISLSLISLNGPHLTPRAYGKCLYSRQLCTSNSGALSLCEGKDGYEGITSSFCHIGQPDKLSESRVTDVQVKVISDFNGAEGRPVGIFKFGRL